MNIGAIIVATVVVAAVGLFIGIFLGVAGKKFAVETDEREIAVRESHSGDRPLCRRRIPYICHSQYARRNRLP